MFSNWLSRREEVNFPGINEVRELFRKNCLG